MGLLKGSTPDISLIVTVLNSASLGPLINHANSANCASLRCVIRGLPKVIIYSTKKIDPGVQLFYSYNSS